MKRFFLYLIFVLLIPVSILAQETVPKVVEVNQEVNSESLNSFLRILAGVDQVTLGGTTYLITTRKPGTATHPVARNYIRSKFESYGLTVFEQSFSGTYSGINIYAVQMGKNPDKVYIICSHYDSVTSYAADDNATGVAAVIEAARVLSQYQLEYTVVYAAWDREENGLIGSKYYAQQAKAQGMDIQAVINLDMLGWDSNDDGLAELHVKNSAPNIELGNTMVSINTAYSIGLAPRIFNPGITNSDHGSFWNQNYTAILLIEGYKSNDFTPYYHTTGDQYNTLNLNYFYKMSNLGVTTLASYVLNSNYIVAGKVFNDADGMQNGMIDGSGTNSGGVLYVNLLDASLKVIASASVNDDGSFLFPDVVGGTYTAQLSHIQGVVGSPAPETALPAGWVYSGENIGASGHDGHPDGLLQLAVEGRENIREVSFGIMEPAMMVSGTYNYYGVSYSCGTMTDARPPLAGVTVTLEGEGRNYSTTTNSAGNYSFPNVLPGTYTVKSEYDAPTEGAVNSLDAGLVNYWSVNFPASLERVRFKAGDVNGDNRLRAGDAGQVNYSFLTEKNQWTPPVKAWSFWKVGEEESDNLFSEGTSPEIMVGSESVTLDLFGMVTGDFNQSMPAHLQLPDPCESLLKNGDSGGNLYPGGDMTVPAAPGESVIIPFIMNQEAKVGAFSFVFRFPNELADIEEVYLYNEQTTPVPWKVAENELRVGWFDSEPLNILKGEALFFVKMRITPDALPGKEIRLSSLPRYSGEMGDENMEVIRNAELFHPVVRVATPTFAESDRQGNLSLEVFPNPARDKLQVSYYIPGDGNVRMAVYDMTGREITRLHNLWINQGSHSLRWELAGWTPGVYLLKMVWNDNALTRIQTKKIVVE